MSLRKTWVVLLKEMRHIVRAKGTLTLIILTPILTMVVMSAAMAQDVRQVPITVLDRDRSPMSRRFLLALSNNDDVVMGQEARSYEQAEEWFNRSLIKALVVIPPGFGDGLEAGRSVEVQVLVDGTDPTTGEHVIKHVASRSMVFGMGQFIKTMEHTTTIASEDVPVDLRVREWYNPGLSNINGIVPAMLAIALTLPAVNVMSSLARERELGTMEIVFATPLGRAELLVGKILPYVALGMVASVLSAMVAVLLFGVPFRGSFVHYLVLSLDFFLVSFSLGALLSVYMRTQSVAMLAGMLVFIFPAILLSGIFYPVGSMPAEVQMESQMLPATPFVTVVRGIMVKGQGLDSLWPQGLLMLGLAFAWIGISIKLFRKKV